jgi:hypothetical protein
VPGIARDSARSFDLVARRQESTTVEQRPAEVLGISQLDAFGPKALGQRDELLELCHILPMNHDVDGQRQPQLTSPLGDLALALEGVDSADSAARLCAHGLQREL